MSSIGAPVNLPAASAPLRLIDTVMALSVSLPATAWPAYWLALLLWKATPGPALHRHRASASVTMTFCWRDLASQLRAASTYAALADDIATNRKARQEKYRGQPARTPRVHSALSISRVLPIRAAARTTSAQPAARSSTEGAWRSICRRIAT